MADPLCATALDYYNTNCRAMCNGRQTKSSYSEGSEEYQCEKSKLNTDVLCFGKRMVLEIESNKKEIKHTSEGIGINIQKPLYAMFILKLLPLAFIPTPSPMKRFLANVFVRYII